MGGGSRRWLLIVGVLVVVSGGGVAATVFRAPSPDVVRAVSGGRTVSPAVGTGCVGSAPPRWRHVVVVVMENHGYDQVVGHAPYIDSLVRACGLATNYHGVAYPSLPNYLAMTGGSTFGVHDDGAPAAHRISGPSIFSQVESRSLQEGMRGVCSSAKGHRYAVKHNPQAYYTAAAAGCRSRDVPLAGRPDLSAAYTFITPDLCHDMHSCPVSAGDDFLKRYVPQLVGTEQYRAGNTAIVVTWDSDDRQARNHVATVVIAPSISPGSRAGAPYNHYSLLRTVEEMLNVPMLRAAATATSMRAGLHL